MQVIDSNRLLGPVPNGVGQSALEDVLARMDALDIAHAVVTPSDQVFGDPRSAAPLPGPHPRITVAPVLIPSAIPDAGTTLPDGARVARAFPTRHRFDPLSPSALAAWAALAERGGVLLLDASEAGFSTVATVCRAVPALQVCLVSPGYRETRRISELLAELPNLTVEMGSLNSAGGVEWLVRHHGPERLVFGTGAPVADDGGPRFALEHLWLDEAEVELIAHGNWERLLGGAR